MTSVRLSTRDELEIFDGLDHQDHAVRYVNATGLETHRAWFDDPAITYLSIDDEHGELCGYFILVNEPERGSVEFRRILIDQHRRGVGQAAISKMEIFCRETLNATRIWLDVYEDNEIGRHIYQKLGYRRFDARPVNGRMMLFYEKTLA